MSMVEKNKSRFVITLEDGKQTYFDFADGNIYGLRGKPVQRFSAKAHKVLQAEQDNNFLALYFVERELTYPDYDGIRDWSISMVETIYSLYADKYSARVLCLLAEYCYTREYKLDKKGVKILTNSLQNIANNNKGSLEYLYFSELDAEINRITYSYLPERIIRLISSASLSARPYIVQDAEKINFRWEHEEWDYLDPGGYGVCSYISRYVELCNRLNHERTYKDLFLSISRMEKEKFLMSEKLCTEYQKSAPLFFEDKNFTVLIPTTADDFKNEADYQHNCVFRSYYPKVVNCNTHIVFIRKKSDIDTPYITCEVNNNGKIVQYLRQYNYCVNDKSAKEFRVAYQEYLSEHF